MVWRWLTEDCREFLSPPWLQIFLAFTSVACGAIVGAEREKREKPAGLRTLVLVCLGSTAFTMASYAFTTTTGDSGRVAAQIVTGIGFLGAGAILHSAGIVRGMTTAATIWAMAATGMIVGIGYVGAGLGLSALCRLVLSAASAVERRSLGGVRQTQIEIVFEPDGGKSRIRIEKIMEDFQVAARFVVDEDSASGIARARFECRLPRRHHREFLNKLASLPEVKQLKESDH